MRILYLCLMMSLLAFVSCQEIHDHKGKTPLIEIEGHFLYQEDMMPVLPMGMSSEDSLLFTQRYIENWAKDILLYEKAKNNIPKDVPVDKLVENYRKALIVHMYQEELITQKLANVISEQEINDYYMKNKALFKLEQPLIKGLFIKVPLKAPQLDKVRRWYKTHKQEEIDQLEKYSLQHAIKYEYFYDKWIPASEVLSMIPLTEKSPEEYINEHRQIELKDTVFHYFLNISEYLGTGNEKPYEFARLEVKDLLMNQKRVGYMEKVKNELYQQAVEDKKIIYKN